MGGGGLLEPFWKCSGFSTIITGGRNVVFQDFFTLLSCRLERRTEEMLWIKRKWLRM